MRSRKFVLLSSFIVLCIVVGIVGFIGLPGGDDSNVPKGHVPKGSTGTGPGVEGTRLGSIILPNDSNYRVRTFTNGSFAQGVLYYKQEIEPSGIVAISPVENETIDELVQSQIGSSDNYPIGEEPTVKDYTWLGGKGKIINIKLLQQDQVRIVAIVIRGKESIQIVFSGPAPQARTLEARLKQYAAKLKAA